MKKKIIAACLAAVCSFAAFMQVMAADKVTYTFSGVNCITDGSTDEIEDKPLTDSITVTTSGDMNRKYAAVTDLKHNNEVGTFPASENFKVKGSYIYLATASSNDNTIIALNMPEIKKGSKVTLTFAKPTVTNNGSTLRNTGDPYAYLKIADRYISINGDNFDTWRTESVVTGEDTSVIEFHCDKWGAVAISKIEISDGDRKKLNSLNISSTQYANIKVNGIKFCADENGKLTVPSLSEGESVTVSAEKDGYKTEEKEITINGDIALDIPLECETDAAYYESDFGNTAGVLTLDGEYKFGSGIDTVAVTKLYANVTFGENGSLAVNTDNGTAVEIKYQDGIYINGQEITKKDNMEFSLFFDRERNIVVCSHNNKELIIENTSVSFDKITSISGENVTVDYVGISYPDLKKIDIEGPDKVSSLPNKLLTYDYEIIPEYHIPDTDFTFSVSGVEGVSALDRYKYGSSILVSEGISGKATICVEYNGHKAYKEIDIIANPKPTEWKSYGSNTLNFHMSELFYIYDVKDGYGNLLNDYDDFMNDIQLKDFKSSDESVIKIDQNGNMIAVGKGKSTITANAYTGADNIISVDYTVDQFYIDGITEGDISYAAGELTENENIVSYKVSYSDGTSENITKTQIPAVAAAADGMVTVLSYTAAGDLFSVRNENVSKGDKFPVSNGNKKVYFCTGKDISLVNKADTTMEGYELKHKAGVKYEISPVYRFENIGDVKDEGKTLDGVFDYGLYNITFKKAETGRGDIYVNGYMVGNNVDQADADRGVTDGALYISEDILVKNGEITVSMCDGSTMLDYVIVEKQPEFYERPKRIYIIGDSLACNYYGDFEKEVGGGRTGWGQVIGDFVDIPVTNLANSGQYAKGLYETAFPSVMENGMPGDILLIECAYNDRNYSTREEMTECVKDMIRQCRDKGINPVLVTPNASEHDYKPSVAWSSYLKDIAIDTDCDLIDLSKESYDFLYSLYGDNVDGVIKKNYNLTEVGGDTLHSSYAGAYKWASIVAQRLKDYFGDDYIEITDFSYTFTDTEGNIITAEVK